MKHLKLYKLFENYSKEEVLTINDIFLDLDDVLEHRIVVSHKGEDFLFVDWDGKIDDRFDDYEEMIIEISHKGEKFEGTVFIGDVLDRVFETLNRLRQYLVSETMIYELVYATGDRDMFYMIKDMESEFYPQNSVQQIDIQIFKRK
jgi:hypothetical protein